MASKQEQLRKRLRTQNLIIIGLAIVIVLLIVVSSTAAWYIRTKTDTADIILSNPVNIYITEFEDLKDENGNVVTDENNNPIKKHTMTQDILEGYNTKVYPGDNIKMRLGMQVGTADLKSSTAYVRVKLAITYENIYTGVISGLEDLSAQSLIEYKDKPDENKWIMVDFNQFNEVEEGKTYVPDYWWIYKTKDKDGKDVAKEVSDMTMLEFLDGYIQLSKTEIRNEHANCKFHINYIVEAIQVANVPDPLANPGYGPWWSFVKGDIEDLQ